MNKVFLLIRLFFFLKLMLKHKTEIGKGTMEYISLTFLLQTEI